MSEGRVIFEKLTMLALGGSAGMCQLRTLSFRLPRIAIGPKFAFICEIRIRSEQVT